MAVGAMERLANSTCHRQAGNGDRLAQEKLPTVLDLERSKRQSGPTRRDEGGPGFDSENEPREPNMGRSVNSRRALKLGIDIGETSVSKYMVHCRKPPSQTWRTFLANHLKSLLVSVDFFTVPTIRFQILYVFLVLAHDRRR